MQYETGNTITLHRILVRVIALILRDQAGNATSAEHQPQPPSCRSSREQMFLLEHYPSPISEHSISRTVHRTPRSVDSSKRKVEVSTLALQNRYCRRFGFTLAASNNVVTTSVWE